MMKLFHEVSQDCSRITTEKYSTSFSSAIKLLHTDMRKPIYNIYGFVRFADEIVDTFHGYNKPQLFANFIKANYDADIQKNFDQAYEGLMMLSTKAKFGVYVAYKYYLSLFKKIKSLPPQHILESRIRIPDYSKVFILAKAGIRSQFNLL